VQPAAAPVTSTSFPERTALLAIPVFAALLWTATGALQPGVLPERAACAGLWLAALPLVAWVRRAVEPLATAQRFALHTLAAVVVALLHAAGVSVARGLWLAQFSSVRALLAHASFEAIAYAAILVGALAIEGFRAQRQALAEASLARARLAEAELSSLLARFQPHFLLNALHSLSALILERPERVPAMVAKLQRFCDASLASDPLQTTLRDEIQRARDYLEIQGLRFEERLRAEFDVPLELERLRIPRDLLQPLLENALRHGVAPDGTARVAVRARAAAGALRLVVEDEGAAVDLERIREGRGLEQVRARLAFVHPGGHGFALEPGSGSGMRVVIDVPIDGAGVPTRGPSERGELEADAVRPRIATVRPRIATLFVGWAAVAALFFGRAAVFGQGGPLSPALRPLAAALAVWCAATPVVVYTAPRIDPARLASLAAHAGTAVLLSTAAAAAAHAAAPPQAGLPLRTRIAFHLPFGLTIYTTVALLAHLGWLPHRRARLLHEAARCREEAARRQAQVLRAGLRREELHASLAAIAESVGTAPDQAIRQVAALGERLRGALRTAHPEEAS
jgi:hypothetical protein